MKTRKLDICARYIHICMDILNIQKKSKIFKNIILMFEKENKFKIHFFFSLIFYTNIHSNNKKIKECTFPLFLFLIKKKIYESSY